MSRSSYPSLRFTLCPFVLFPQPLRAVILGPPASGKTTVAQQLCEHYKLHHIKIKDVIDEEIESLVGETIYSITL